MHRYNLNRLFIHISDYIRAIYHKYAPILIINGSYRTPMPVNARLSNYMCPKVWSEVEYMSKVPYREVVGALLWRSLICLPDLFYAVNQVAKYISDPGVLHWEAVQRILLYAYQYKDWGVLYQF